MHTESHYILHGVRAGAKGVVLKTHASEDLVRAIREASRGGTYMSSQVSSALVQAYQGKTELRPDPLSPRERQVQLIAEGKTTKEVATFLQISVKTSETHRTRIMTKLNRRGKPSKSGGLGEHTSELQSPCKLLCPLLPEKKKNVSHSPATRARNRAAISGPEKSHASSSW